MANNTASIKSLARNLKNAAAKNKAPKIFCSKVNATTWCGCHSELPTDTKWNKVPRNSAFNRHVRERGNNRALMAAMAACARGEF